MKQNMLRFMIAQTLLVMLFAGCVKRDLEMRPIVKDGYAEIVLDWGGQAYPKSAHFLFYDESNKLVKDIKGVTDGFKGSLPVGKYRIVVRNEDAINVDYRGLDNYATAEVFVLDKGAKSGQVLSGETSLIQEPQQVFGIGVFKEFEQLVIEPEKTTKATVVPKLLTRQVNFLFNVNGSSVVSSIGGVLSGVASGVFLATGIHNIASGSSLQFEASRQGGAAGNEFVANVNVFNLLTTPESVSGTNTIDIILTDNTGLAHEATFDLSDAIKEIIDKNGGAIPIQIPVEIALEVKPIEGLTATVRAWDNSGSGSGSPRP